MELKKPISLVTESVSPYVRPPFQLSLCVGVDTFHSVGVDTFHCVGVDTNNSVGVNTFHCISFF